MPWNGLVEHESRPTVEKVRVVTERNQQVVRIDYEKDCDVSGEIELQIVRSIERTGAGAGVLVVSDYLKGAITQRWCRRWLRSKVVARRC